MKREVGNSGGGGVSVETQGTVTVNKGGIFKYTLERPYWAASMLQTTTSSLINMAPGRARHDKFGLVLGLRHAERNARARTV